MTVQYTADSAVLSLRFGAASILYFLGVGLQQPQWNYLDLCCLWKQHKSAQMGAASGCSASPREVGRIQYISGFQPYILLSAHPGDTTLDLPSHCPGTPPPSCFLPSSFLKPLCWAAQLTSAGTGSSAQICAGLTSP